MTLPDILRHLGLTGRRIRLVEDEYMAADALCEKLAEAG